MKSLRLIDVLLQNRAGCWSAGVLTKRNLFSGLCFCITRGCGSNSYSVISVAKFVSVVPQSKLLFLRAIHKPVADWLIWSPGNATCFQVNVAPWQLLLLLLLGNVGCRVVAAFSAIRSRSCSWCEDCCQQHQQQSVCFCCW